QGLRTWLVSCCRLSGAIDHRRVRDNGLPHAENQPQEHGVVKVKPKDKARAIALASALASQVGSLPAPKMWIDFDQEADVLYISLHRPQRATETVDLEDEGILLNYRDDELVGITVLEASKR